MIGIVGAGYAGLAAAYRLQQAGEAVRIFEATDAIGGLAATYPTRGDPIEQFYHHLSRSEETIVALAEALGVGGAIDWRVGTTAHYIDGTVHPLNTPLQILAYPHMTIGDKLKLGLLTMGVDIHRFPPQRGAFEELSAYESESVETFVTRHTSRRVYTGFVEPLLASKFGERREEISAAWFLGRIRFRGERSIRRGEILGYPDGGVAAITEALIEAVGRETIACERPVRAVEMDTDGPVALRVDPGDERVPVDGVVLATMPSVLEALTGIDSAIEFQAAVCALLVHEEPITDQYWVNIAERCSFGALIEHTNFVDPARYGGQHLSYLAAYVQRLDDPLWQADDAAIAERWLDELQGLFPALDPETITAIEIARNPQAAPLYVRGYAAELIPTDLATRGAPGVAYAGMGAAAQYPERSLNGAIEAGFEAADALVARHR